MTYPEVIEALIAAQNDQDSTAYAACFSETAIVHDEGHTHKGKAEIAAWIADSNEKYHAMMKPLGYEEHDGKATLKAETSGNFPGSPILMTYHLGLSEGRIDSLRITG